MESCNDTVLYPWQSFSFEGKLIGHIVKEYPDTAKVMEKYFGKNCLKRGGFKTETLPIACILFGVDPNRLIEEMDVIHN